VGYRLIRSDVNKYFQKIFSYLILMLFAVAAGVANWYWPFYIWFGDTSVYRFIWLGIFFIILDIILEILTRSWEQIKLMSDKMGFANDLKKISSTFHVVSRFVLPNNFRLDHVVIGSSGVWFVNVIDGNGYISFNGEELMQDGKILKGLITQTLENAYSLSGFLKQKLTRDIKVAPVVAFSSSRADLKDMPKEVRGVFITSRKDVVSLIENTDFQLVDQKTIEDIFNILKK